MMSDTWTSNKDIELGGIIPTPAANFDFTEKSVRLGFLRKVYAILFLQLFVTFGFVTLCTLERSVHEFIWDNLWIVYSAWGIVILSALLLFVFKEFARTTPGNYIVLSILTLAMSWAAGATSGLVQAEEVIMAVGITLSMTVAIAAFSFQSRFDFTFLSGFVVVLLDVLIFFAIFGGIWHNKVLNVLYASLGALLFGVFLVVNTELILGGKHRNSYSPENYIFAALTLYSDIVIIFIAIIIILALAAICSGGNSGNTNCNGCNGCNGSSGHSGCTGCYYLGCYDSPAESTLLVKDETVVTVTRSIEQPTNN